MRKSRAFYQPGQRSQLTPDGPSRYSRGATGGWSTSSSNGRRSPSPVAFRARSRSPSPVVDLEASMRNQPQCSQPTTGDDGGSIGLHAMDKEQLEQLFGSMVCAAIKAEAPADSHGPPAPEQTPSVASPGTERTSATVPTASVPKVAGNTGNSRRIHPKSTAAMSSMMRELEEMKESTYSETTFTVRTDTDNDALLVPEGIETVLVDSSAHRVIIPEGVEVVRLQTANSSNLAAPRPPPAGHEATGTPHWLRENPGRNSECEEPVQRVKREAVLEAVTASKAAAPPKELEAERSLSLPSVPGSPPGSPDEATDPPPKAPLARDDEPDLSDEVPLRPSVDAADSARVVRQQPGRNGSARLSQTARRPLIAHGHSHVAHAGHAHVVHPNYREQFLLEHEHGRPVTRKAGRFCADVLCCWLGV